MNPVNNIMIDTIQTVGMIRITLLKYHSLKPNRILYRQNPDAAKNIAFPTAPPAANDDIG